MRHGGAPEAGRGAWGGTAAADLGPGDGAARGDEGGEGANGSIGCYHSYSSK